MLRQPDAYLLVQGARVDVVSLEAHLTREAKSDTLHATLAISGLPASCDLAWWSDTSPIDVEAVITLDGEGGGAPLFKGSVTQVEPNWVSRTLEVRAHDKTRDLMEEKTPDAHRNKTAGDIIQEIAKRHGLKVDVEGGTLKAGRLYDIDHVHMTDQLTDWDVVNYLADTEGLSPSVKGDTLYLRKDDEDLPTLRVDYEPPTPESYERGDFMALTAVRNLDLTGKTKVKVKSYDHKTRKTVEVEKTMSGKGGRGVLYEYRPPGLKQDRASRIAEKRLRRAAGQERGVSLEIPGDPAITARMRLDLAGTGTAWDQTYDVESVEHRINVEEGYRVHVSAKAPSKGRTVS